MRQSSSTRGWPSEIGDEDFAKILMFLRASYIGTFLQTKFVSGTMIKWVVTYHQPGSRVSMLRLPYPLFNSGSSILMAKSNSMLHSYDS
jgi:hypothetical protein